MNNTLEITNYRHYEKDITNKTGYSLTLSYGNNKDLTEKIYLTDYDYTNGNGLRKFPLRIKGKNGHITGLSSLGIEYPDRFTGNTNDNNNYILLVIKEDNYLEIFQLSLKKEHTDNILDLWIEDDPLLINEIERVRTKCDNVSSNSKQKGYDR